MKENKVMKEQTELEKIWSTKFRTRGIDLGSLQCKSTDGKSLLVEHSYGDFSITIVDENGTHKEFRGEKVGFCHAEGNFVYVNILKTIYIDRVSMQTVEKLAFEIEEGSW